MKEKRTKKKKNRSTPVLQISNLISDEWLTSPFVIPLYAFRLNIHFPGAGNPTPVATIKLQPAAFRTSLSQVAGQLIRVVYLFRPSSSGLSQMSFLVALQFRVHASQEHMSARHPPLPTPSAPIRYLLLPILPR
jgi:hypothetical protein